MNTVSPLLKNAHRKGAKYAEKTAENLLCARWVSAVYAWKSIDLMTVEKEGFMVLFWADIVLAKQGVGPQAVLVSIRLL